MRGMPLEPTTVASVDNIMLAAVLILFILIGFNARHIARLFSGFFTDVWSVRQRDNIFKEHVASESNTMLLLTLQTSILEGVLIAGYMARPGLPPSIGEFALCSAFALGFNIFSIAACSTVGFTFTSRAMAAQWRRGLYASQAMLGMILLVPTVIVIVHPRASATGLAVGAVLYILARLLYIAKGFRIFYINLFSLLYFILYLCTLEIIPLLVIARLIPDIQLNN